MKQMLSCVLFALRRTFMVNSKTKDKKRAQPGDFEKQVDQIRKDIRKVKENLSRAQKYVIASTFYFLL